MTSVALLTLFIVISLYMPRLLTVYIFKEMLVPFLLSAVILTITVLLGKAIKFLELFLTKGVGIKYLLLFLLSIAPNFLVYTVPAAFLVGILIACSRLSSDNEVTAMKANGIGLMAIMKPIFSLAVIAFSITLAMTLYFYPLGNRSLKKILYDVARTGSIGAMEERTFYNGFKGMVVYVDRIGRESSELNGIFLSEYDEKGQSTVIFAEKGRLSSKKEELKMTLHLENGEMHKLQPQTDAYHLLSFSTYALKVNFNEDVAPDSTTHARELSTKKLMERIKEAKKENSPYVSLTMDLHKRFTLPASVFIFSLIGLPLGLQKVRQARLTGFGIATALIIVYYLFMKSFEIMGKSGSLNPVAASWAPTVILFAFGLLILSRTLKERPIAFFSAIDDAIAFLTGKIKGLKK